MHPAVIQFVECFEKEANRTNSYRNRLGKLEIAFLVNVWGPAFDYDFAGLSAEFPFRDFRGGRRFNDFRYDDGVKKTIIELDGFTTHAKSISSAKFDDHLEVERVVFAAIFRQYGFPETGSMPETVITWNREMALS